MTTNLTPIISMILYNHDPIEIAQMMEATDEYTPEARIIVEHIASIASEEELLNLVYRVFRQQFSETLTQTIDVYRPITHEIWNYVQSM